MSSTAFASQAVMSVQTIGLDMAKVNPNGGAIAFGHPLGATGARQIATLYPEMKRKNATLGVTSMCIGSGCVPHARLPRIALADAAYRMGMAALFVNEQ
jgi:acetyl-CoA acyltransferase 1